MRLLLYKDLDLRRVKPSFDKMKAAIEADDFRSADVKKLNAGPYYRAKLDYANRLLLRFARVEAGAGVATARRCVWPWRLSRTTPTSDRDFCAALG